MMERHQKRKKSIKKPRAITFGGRIALGPTIKRWF